MNPARRPVGGSPTRPTTVATREASPEDLREILAGFVGYYGTFEIDEPAHTVIHRVQVHLIPRWVGAEMRRAYDFPSGNRLVWQRDGA